MERLCGMLLPLVKSRINPYKNLANNIILLEQFFHLPYFNISRSIFHTKIEKEWKTNLVFGNIEEYNEEFYWPSMNYTLSNNEKTHLINTIKELNSKYEIINIIFIYL
jgi:hypothetical protein